MEVTGKIKLFVEFKDGKEGRKFPVITTSIGTQKQDKTYSNITLEVKFNKTNFPEENLHKLDVNKVYDLEIKNGWLAVREWTQNENIKKALYVYVKEGTLTGAKPRKPRPQNGELPF